LLLVIPTFTQFGFINDVANTVKNTVEDGTKTVSHTAVDGVR
jgi:hypothetical protein